MYLCCEGDEVDISYNDHVAEVTNVIPRGRDFYDSDVVITPTCFVCRSRLKTDGSDIRCSNINCAGTERGRVERMLRLYSQHRYGPCHHEDVVDEMATLKEFDAQTLAQVFSIATVSANQTFPMISDMLTTFGDINTERYRNSQIERDDRLAVLIDGMAIPGLSAMDCVNIVLAITDDPPFNYYEEIWNILSQEHAIEDLLDMSPREASYVVEHVHRRKDKRGTNSIRSILYTLSQL